MRIRMIVFWLVIAGNLNAQVAYDNVSSIVEVDLRDSAFIYVPNRTDINSLNPEDQINYSDLKSAVQLNENPESPVQIHGSDRFVSVVLNPDEYGVIGTTDEYNELVRITQMLYGTFNDKFDFIVYILNNDQIPSTIRYAGICYSMSNSVEGIGRGIYNGGKYWGSAGKLKSVIVLSRKDYLLFGPALHEILHNWANFGIKTHAYINNVEYDDYRAHWGISGGGAQLGGFLQSTLKDSVDGNPIKYQATNYNGRSFGQMANGGNSVPYSNFELYLMGLIGIDQVEEFDVFSSFSFLDGSTGTFEASSRVRYTQSKIINELGPRIPDYTASQKEFRILFAVLSPEPVVAETLSLVDNQVENFTRTGEDDYSTIFNFWEATQNKAVLNPNHLSRDLKTFASLDFKEGWNIFSSYTLPDFADMKTIFQPLIDNNSLVKVQDEQGNSLEDLGIFGGWNNGIGNISPSKGYKVKMNQRDTLITGGSVVEFPYPIPLVAGWNIAGYPQQVEADGMTIVQQLIDRGTLIKVQDEAGNSIENLGIFGGWQNNIGNFVPGEGYKIKVASDDTLWIEESYPKSTVVSPEVVATTHFIPVYDGNGLDHMNIHIIGFSLNLFAPGDELAVFDGDICVGAVKILPYHLSGQMVSLAVSANDDDGMPGFTEGNQFLLKLWSKALNREFELEPDLLSGASTFLKHESSLMRLEKISVAALKDVHYSDLTHIKCYPNPFSEEIIVEINLNEEAEVQVEVLNQLGQRVKCIVENRLFTNGIHQLTWNGRNETHGQVLPGIYYLKVQINDNVVHRKILLVK